MLPLPMPTFTSREVFETSISNYEDPPYSRLSTCINLIEQKGNEYSHRANAGTLWTLQANDVITPGISAKDIKDVYDCKIAKKGQPGRKYYDVIRSAPPHGRCPLCAHRIVSQVDHYLPKSKYPIYSTIPTNLIPSCSDCNKSKTAGVLMSADQQTLHPYFDNISGYHWLKAHVNQTNPVSFTYSVVSDATWGQVLTDRVRLHFRKLGLGVLYGSNAGSELSNVRLLLQSYYLNGGIALLQSELESKQVSYMDSNLNSWQAAMYASLRQSAWFCNTGVML